VYIDNFIIFFSSLEKHQKHLDIVFYYLDILYFLLNSKKCYIRYLLVTILGQKVNAFSIATIDKRIAAIRYIEFPANTSLLEIYIGAVGYIRDKILYFTQLLALL
jgi:hypothetical protein